MATFEKSLGLAQTALRNAIDDPKLYSRLAFYGYGLEQLQEGLMLCETVANLQQSQSDTRFNKITIKQNFREHWLEAKFQFQRDLHVARFVFGKDEDTSSALQLNGNYSKNFDTWHKYAKNFYFSLRNKPELQAAVASKGLTPDRIDQGIGAFGAIRGGSPRDPSPQGQQQRQPCATRRGIPEIEALDG